MGFGFFGIFEILFFLVFALFVVIFAATAIRGISEWNKNNNSPRITVDATVVSRRSHTSRHHHGGANGMHHHTTSTSYYVTFQVASGDRMELRMAGHQYGLLVEGDQGKLTFQGTRFLDFQRT